MATQEALVKLMAEDEAVRESLAEELLLILAAFDLYSISGVKEELSDLLSASTLEHVYALQALYAEFYEMERFAAGYPRTDIVVPRVETSVDDLWVWGYGDLYGDISEEDIARAKRKLVNAADGAVVSAGRNVVTETALSDPLSGRMIWKRVALGDSCGFCVSMAAREPVSLSAVQKGAFASFHHHCRCVIVPVWV